MDIKKFIAVFTTVTTVFAMTASADTLKASCRLKLIEQPFGGYVDRGDGSEDSQIIELSADENALIVNISPDTEGTMEYYIALYDVDEGVYATANETVGFSENMVGPVGDGDFTFTGLKPGGRYEIRVSSAINSPYANITVTGTNRPKTEGVSFDLSIFEQGSKGGNPEIVSSPSSTVSRSQMATFIRALLPPLTEPVTVFNAGKSGFSDVANDTLYRNDIEVLQDLHILVGVGGNLFEPNSPVTVAQAVKMTVSSLGYGPYAESLGGWPEGYIKCGRLIGISTDKDPNEPAGRIDVDFMLKKAADIPHMHVVEYAPDGSMKLCVNTNFSYNQMK